MVKTKQGKKKTIKQAAQPQGSPRFQVFFGPHLVASSSKLSLQMLDG